MIDDVNKIAKEASGNYKYTTDELKAMVNKIANEKLVEVVYNMHLYIYIEYSVYDIER